MGKTYLVTPAFCKAALLEQQLEWLHAGGIPSHVEHVIIDQHYPIDKPTNRKRIAELASKFKATLVDSGKDLGLHEGINNAADVIGFKAGDVVVGCDPDDRPVAGFIGKIEKAFQADPTIALCALNFYVIDERFAEGRLIETVIGDQRAWVHPTVEMINVVGFNWAFVEAIGGLKEPHAFYGGLESYLYPRWRSRGMKLVYLPDVRSDASIPDRANPNLFDPEYRTWKTAHVGGDDRSFENWLREFHPERLGR
jgi:hypothetical protein